MVETEDDWYCGLNRFDVSTCTGLQCNLTYITTENANTNAFGQVYYECVKQISYNGIVFNAPNNYFFMPAGCEYNTAWDAQYPCFGGMKWNAFASGCPTTCHYTPTEVSALSSVGDIDVCPMCPCITKLAFKHVCDCGCNHNAASGTLQCTARAALRVPCRNSCVGPPARVYDSGDL